MTAAKKPAETSPTFDQRLARLEAIVAELESGGIALEPAIDRFEEGVELLRGCRTILDGYRKRVEELSAQAEGGLVPYAGDPDAEPRGPRGPLGPLGSG